MKKLCWIDWLQILGIAFKEKHISSLLVLISLKWDISEIAFYKCQGICTLLRKTERVENIFSGIFKHLFWDGFLCSHVKSIKKGGGGAAQESTI